QQLPRRAVAPEDVASAVAVEVALSNDPPRARRGSERTTADYARAVHQPVQHLAGGRVVPEDVAHAVIVELMRGGPRAKGARESLNCQIDADALLGLGSAHTRVKDRHAGTLQHAYHVIDGYTRTGRAHRGNGASNMRRRHRGSGEACIRIRYDRRTRDRR